MKKLFLFVLMILLMVGCGSKDKGGDEATIRVGWWGGSSRHEATLEVIKLFEEKHPNIKVKPEYSGWTGYNDKLTVQMVGSSAPDVMQINWNMLYSLGRNSFYDMNKLEDINLSNYPVEVIDAVTIDDRVVAIPWGITGRVFYYNKATFDLAGIDVPSSFDELIESARVFKRELGDDYYPFTTDTYSTFLLTLYYLEQKTGRGFIENDGVAYSVDEIEDGFNFIKGLVDEGVVPALKDRMAEGVLTLEHNPDWISGKYAGTYEWDSTAEKYINSLENGGTLVVGEMISDLGIHNSAFNKISMTFALNSKTDYPEEAAIFLNFITTDPEAVRILGLTRGIPVNKRSLEVLEENGMLSGLNFEGNQKVLGFMGKGIHYYFEHSQLQDFYRNLSERLDAGVVSSRGAAEELLERVDGFLKENVK